MRCVREYYRFAKQYGHVADGSSGMIDTPMSQAARIPVKDTKDEALSEASRVALGRKGKAEEVADLIVYLLSDGASFITGNAVSVDGGWQC